MLSGPRQTALFLWATALIPGLIAFNVPPSPTLFNQAAAVGVGGLAVAALGSACVRGVCGIAMRAATLLAGLLLIVTAALLSSALGTLPWAIGHASAGLILATVAFAV